MSRVLGILSGIPVPTHEGYGAKDVSERTNERREYERNWRRNNAEKLREQKRIRYRANREKELKRGKRYRTENPDKVKQTNANWTARNREKRAAIIRNYINGREAKDPAFKLLRSIRARLRRAIGGNAKSGRTIELLGCTAAELKAHIEQQFLPGMTWENRGFRGWHIDHKKALASLDLADPEELAKACHYTNLQPLWWRDNLVKGKNSHDC